LSVPYAAGTGSSNLLCSSEESKCEPDADDFLAAGGAVLAEPLADRAQHEMPAQPVLCRPL